MKSFVFFLLWSEAQMLKVFPTCSFFQSFLWQSSVLKIVHVFLHEWTWWKAEECYILQDQRSRAEQKLNPHRSGTSFTPLSQINLCIRLDCHTKLHAEIEPFLNSNTFLKHCDNHTTAIKQNNGKRHLARLIWWNLSYLMSGFLLGMSSTVMRNFKASAWQK